MEKEVQEVINKINELRGKEFGQYIDYLINQNDPKIMKNKEVLIAIAQRVNDYGYHQRIIKSKFEDIGLSMRDELDKIDQAKTMVFLEEHPELSEIIDIATKWWIEVIKKPYFANYNSQQMPIEMGIWFQPTPSEKKIEDRNNQMLTKEKEKAFVESLSYEIADRVRKEGSCKLSADTFGFDVLGKALEEADLRVSFPKKITMIVTTNQIKLSNSNNNLDIVYTNDSSKENDSNKKM
ncbi:MAG: hypothetical protein IJI58_04335 [Bacilli bacterium]|nr:hypothetical protein [Bacilli bacterium]